MEYEPVTHAATERSIGRRPSGASVSVTVHRYAGGSGPAVYVQATQHGIELNGPAALRRLHGRLTDAALAGTVVVVPVANPLAFDDRSYISPVAFDARNPNLNRVWPGDDGGSFVERLAARLWGLVDGADAVVDLHTGTPDMLEHVRITEESSARTLATAFGTDHLLVDSVDDGTSGTLRAAAERAGVPALTVELANSRAVSRDAVETGVGGVENVLRELNLLETAPTGTPEQTVLRDDARDVITEASGLFEPRADVSVGEHVEAGETLGTVHCPRSFERLRTVTAPEAGVPYSLVRGGAVVEGERVAGVATRG